VKTLQRVTYRQVSIYRQKDGAWYEVRYSEWEAGRTCGVQQGVFACNAFSINLSISRNADINGFSIMWKPF